MIHFPRDLWVDIPGRGKDKINAAYAYGREPLLVETIENLLKIRIHHVAKTNFDGFENMTDAVGGVRVYAEEASNGTGNGGPVVIKEGWNDLNGEQALSVVRERYTLSEGDISRGRRQLAFLKALMLKATSPETIANPLKIAKFTDAATENLVLDQDLSIGQPCATTRSRCATSGRATSSSRPHPSPGSAPLRAAPRSTSSTSRGWPTSVRPCAPTPWTTTATSSSRPDRHRPASPSLDALELRGDVGLHRLVHRRHVHDPHQVAVDVPVDPVAGGVGLRGGAAHDAVGAHLDLPRLRDTGIHLDEPGGVAEQQLDVRAVLGLGHRAPEADLGGERPHLVAVLVEQPGPRAPLEERPAVVPADHLLAEPLRLDRRVAHEARALPAAHQPRERGEVDVEGGVEVEDHRLQSMDSPATTLVVKVTCGTEALERLNQGFTVAATALASGVDGQPVAHRRRDVDGGPRPRRGGRAAARRPPRRAARRPPRGGSGHGLRPVRGRRGLTEDDLAAGAVIRGAAAFVEEVLAPGARALVY